MEKGNLGSNLGCEEGTGRGGRSNHQFQSHRVIGKQKKRGRNIKLRMKEGRRLSRAKRISGISGASMSRHRNKWRETYVGICGAQHGGRVTVPLYHRYRNGGGGGQLACGA